MAGPRRSEEARFLLLTRNGPSCLKQHSSVPHSALVKQWVAAYTQRKDKIQKFATHILANWHSDLPLCNFEKEISPTAITKLICMQIYKQLHRFLS